MNDLSFLFAMDEEYAYSEHGMSREDYEQKISEQIR
jgi:hypothetical protein